MNALILLRGLPGSGKTTLANLLSEEGKYPVFSVDDYFTHPETGDYQFKFDENYLAYQSCERNTRLAMERGEKKIILHNTFTLEWELKPYFEMASKFSYQVFVMTIENRHSGENVHGVSKDQLEKMAANYRVVLF
jgi:predicted kinase